MTSTLQISWQKNTYEIPFSTTESIEKLFETIKKMTGVPIERQKLMPKTKNMWKGVLKSSTYSLASLPSSPNNTYEAMLMGSADVVILPKVKTVFLEDLGEEAKAKLVLPSGLVNLGNTCYMNSTLQCLRRVTSLRDGLSLARTQDPIVQSLNSTFLNLDRSSAPIPPHSFLQSLRTTYPQFAQQGRQGGMMQQDAEEFSSSLFATLASKLDKSSGAISAGYKKELSDDELGGANNLIDSLFGLRMEETMTCPEAGSLEPSKVSYDLHRKLVCNIQGGHGSNIQVDHLADGVKLAMKGELEKNSEVLGRNAVWNKESKIDRLPKYLMVQFMRFYWKATPESRDHQGVKCKMMRPVTFNETLDVYDFCSDKVKKTLKVWRDKAQTVEDEKITKRLKELDEKWSDIDANKKAKTEGAEAEGDVKMASEDDNEEMDDDTKAALAMSMSDVDSAVSPPAPPPIITTPVGAGLPEEFQGMYELFAVVTHKGRDAESGHYMGWVRQDNAQPVESKDKDGNVQKSEKWLVFDDDEVSECLTEDVLKLKGGGDWHMAYLNFYRAKE